MICQKNLTQASLLVSEVEQNHQRNQPQQGEMVVLVDAQGKRKRRFRFTCLTCGKQFEVDLWRAKRGVTKYCCFLCKQKGVSRKYANKRGEMQRYSGLGKTYIKLNGRHMHRVIAEQILGRSLLRGEIVHHINGNKRDNRPENIQVFKNQSEHAFAHRINGKFSNKICNSENISNV